MPSTPSEPTTESSSLQSIAVIGAGQRGRAFALRCMKAGFAVVLEDVLSSNLRKAAELVEESSPDLLDRLQLAGSVEDAVRDADLAIDFVPDELESKLEIFSMMDRMAPPKTIFCTPTALSISDLASCTYRPELCIALQPLTGEIHTQVHLVSGSATAPQTTEQVTLWLQSLGIDVQQSPEHAATGHPAHVVGT